MRLIQEVSLVAIDFESTGERFGKGALPIQVGMASVEKLVILPQTFFSSYLQVRERIEPKVQKKHFLTNETLQEAPSLLSLWPVFEKKLRGRYLVAHGRGTEKRFLRAFPMHGFGPWIDTLSLSRAMVPGLPSYQLSDLIFSFGLLEEMAYWLPHFRWHEALSDAIASLILLLHLIKKGNLATKPISLLTQ